MRNSTNSGCGSSFSPKPLATPLYVTSSSVGPTPPDVNTTEYSSEATDTVFAISSA